MKFIYIGSVYTLCVVSVLYLFYLPGETEGTVVPFQRVTCRPNKGEHRLEQKKGNDCFCETEQYTYGNKDAASRSRTVKIGFVGDTGAGSNALDTFRMLKDNGAELIVHLGDLDYKDNPGLMEDVLDNALGTKFPVLYIIGNHDINNWTEYLSLYKARIERSTSRDSIYCEGNLGVSGYCVFKGVHIEMVGYGTLCDSSQHLDVSKRNLQASNSLWKVCGWHKIHSSFQLGSESTEVSLDMYNTCIKEGAIVMTGHNHSYGRTKPIRDAETKSVSSSYDLRKGKTMIFVNGVGGRGLYSGNDEYRRNGWWDVAYTGTSTPRAEHGGVICTFETNGHGNCKYIAGYSRKVLDNVDFSVSVENGGSSGGTCTPKCPECTKSWEPPVEDGCGGICPMDNCKYNERCSESAGLVCVHDDRCVIRCVERGGCLKKDETVPTNWCGGTCDNIPLCEEQHCRIEEIEVCD